MLRAATWQLLHCPAGLQCSVHGNCFACCCCHEPVCLKHFGRCWICIMKVHSTTSQVNISTTHHQKEPMHPAAQRTAGPHSNPGSASLCCGAAHVCFCKHQEDSLLCSWHSQGKVQLKSPAIPAGPRWPPQQSLTLLVLLHAGGRRHGLRKFT